MPQIINTNIASLNSQRNLNTSQTGLQTSLQRLSSGLRINSAKDDAAGLAISERMTSQIRGLNQAQRNANDGVSLAQTGEGALSSAGDILQRIRELAVQAANASNNSGDRQAIQAEIGQQIQELDRIATTTQFNGKTLFDGTFGTANFQVGANANQVITTSNANLRITNYGNNQHGAVGDGLGAGTVAVTPGELPLTGAGSFNINGYIGSKSVNVLATDKASDIANNINNVTGSTGVSATARTDVLLTFDTAGAYNLNVAADNALTEPGGVGTGFVGFEAVNFTITGTNSADGLSAAVTAFNDKSAKTGLVASINATNTGVIISSSTGANITLEDTIAANAGDVTVQGLRADQSTALGVPAVLLAAGAAADGVVITGQVTFNSEKSFSVDQSAVGNSNLLAAPGAATVGSTLNTVSTLDVTTFLNATQALMTVDSALSLINGERAKLGALQSRFEATISNLSITSENLSASRSRIRDADYAAETAILTRGQILQQAGVAMLAQANSMPNSVLTLLK
ncbi:MAG: flagellin [Sulfuricellaceae bacterium]